MYSFKAMSKIRVNAAAAEDPSPEPEQLPISMRAMGLKPMRYLDALNPEQREAVETLDGPLLVLAGARSAHRGALRRQMFLNSGLRASACAPSPAVTNFSV